MTATAGGTWTIDLTDVADGVHVYTAKATDAAPNTSPASAARTITVDTVDPTLTDRSPLADATGVAVDVTVTAELSEALDPATVSDTSVTLTARLDRGPGDRHLQRVDRHHQPDPDADLAARHDLHRQPRRRPSRTSPAALSATSWDFTTINPTDTTPPDAPVITAPAADGYDPTAT